MEAPILQIIVLKGPRNGEILVGKPESTIQIGRVMKGNHLALRDPGISQKHLCFRFIQADSSWFVSDLDTSNGTILNGSRIEASVPVPVSDGDVLEIGEKTKLGVKIVAPKVLEGNEEENDARKRRVTRRGGSSRANSSRVCEEKVELKQAQSKASAPVRGRRNNARPISAMVSSDEQKETSNPYLASDPGVEMDQKGTERGRGNIVARNSNRALKEQNESIDSVMHSYSETEASDQNRGAKPTRKPRRGKSSRVLKEVDTNCSVDSVLEVKDVDMKRKGLSREKGRGKASTVSEEKEKEKEKENNVNLVLNLDSDSTGSDHVAVPKVRKGIKARNSADYYMVIEEEEDEEEDVGVEGEKNREKGKVDFEKMTLDEWFDSMKWFLPKVIYDESERIIGILKEKARKFDELGEVGTDATRTAHLGGDGLIC